MRPDALIRLLAVLGFLFYYSNVCAQSVFAPYNPEYYYLIDRYEILNGAMIPKLHTTFKPLLRADIYALTDSVQRDSSRRWSASDRFNLSYLRADNWESGIDSLKIGASKRPIFKHFYSKKNSFYHVKTNEFLLQVNPVINIEQNSDNRAYPLSLNSRGIEMRGAIGSKLGFYTYLTDNQAFAPQYVTNYINRDSLSPEKSFHGEGFTKDFTPNQRLFGRQNQTGYDFFSARGYIYFNIIKQISLQFGHDKNMIGNGYRSLFLSDNSSKYLFLRAITKVWRFNYTNMFAEMTAVNISGSSINPRKYMAMHHLSFNITRNFNIGLFESIIFNRGDSLSPNPGFELNYLNPVIFYREVESYLGSKDKTTVGVDAKLNLFKRISLYGQFALHEFKLNNLMAQKGWWGNKYVWQVGIKYINAFEIKNLDLQFEHNFVRPFAYMDKTAYTAYTNFNQPLAHPLGANFYEMLGIIRYQPIPRLTLQAKGFYMVYGQDFPGTNYGGNITKSYTTRTLEEGNVVAQGNRTNVLFASFGISYMLFHNFFVEVRYTYRDEKNQISRLNDQFTTFGIRWNAAPRLHEF